MGRGHAISPNISKKRKFFSTPSKDTRKNILKFSKKSQILSDDGLKIRAEFIKNSIHSLFRFSFLMM